MNARLSTLAAAMFGLAAGAAPAAAADWTYSIDGGRPVLANADGLFRAECHSRAKVLVHIALDPQPRRPGTLVAGSALLFGDESSGLPLRGYQGYAEGDAALSALRLYRWGRTPTMWIRIQGYKGDPVAVSLADAGEPAAQFLSACHARR